jgi:diaminopimelate epimerase
MKFEKWQALGNDYVIVEGEELPEPIAPTFDAFEAWWGERESELAA